MKIAGAVIACFVFSLTAWAQNAGQTPNTPPTTPDASQSTPSSHPAAVTYSDAYQLRAKIHRISSFSTLPLFAAEYALGQSLYNNPSNSDAKKGLHAAVGTGIIGLFGVNAVTGVWNMMEDRHNPVKGHKLRLVHGLLMLTATAGFAATAATGPHNGDGRHMTNISSSNKALHRDLAIGSMGVGTIGYTLMLFGNR